MYPFSVSLKSVSAIVSTTVVHPSNTYTIIDHGILEERYLSIGLQLCQEIELRLELKLIQMSLPKISLVYTHNHNSALYRGSLLREE